MTAPGARVAILFHTSDRYLETHFALAKLGRVAVPINHRASPADIARILHDATASALVLDSSLRDLAGATQHVLGAELPTLEHCLGAAPSAYEAVVGAGPAPEPEATTDDSDLHVLGYTSGTTGTAKGSMISDRNAVYSALTYGSALGVMPEPRI